MGNAASALMDADRSRRSRPPPRGPIVKKVAISTTMGPGVIRMDPGSAEKAATGLEAEESESC